jgi:hypothetical protein
MNTHWKIFNVINLICLVLVSTFFIWPDISGFHSLDNSQDVSFYSVIIIIWLIVICNSLHNIFLTKIYASCEKLTLFRKVCFWVLLSLFSMIVLGLTFQFIVGLSLRIKYSAAYRPYLNYSTLLKFLSVSLTGLYIIVMQIILFFRIKRSYVQSLDNFIDEIGSQ